MMRLFILILAATLSFSCKEKKQTLQEKQKEIKVGNLDEANTYFVKEIGWTVQLPERWKVITQEEIKKMNEKGKKAMETSLGTEIDYSDVQELVSIKKDQFNVFISNMQKFDSTTDGTYDDRVMAINEMMRTTFKSQNMKFEDHVGATRIDGIMFDIFDITLFAPDNPKKVILSQSMYSANINGYDFSMMITFNNNFDKQILTEIVESSKFSIKDR